MQSCSICFAPTVRDPCRICGDLLREPALICVVETFEDLLAIEAPGEYHGVYHVLHGAINPLEGFGPDQLRLRELFERAQRPEVDAIILATRPNTNGDATAEYIRRALGPLGVHTTRR